MELLKHQEIPVGDWWDIWVLNTGRAAGKTTAATNFAKAYLEQGLPVIYLIIPRMESYIVNELIEELGTKVKYNKTENRLKHDNGGYIQFKSPHHTAVLSHFRGSNYAALVWEDVETINNPALALEVLNMVGFGLRLGAHPRMMFTLSDEVPVWLTTYTKNKNTAFVRAETKCNVDNLPLGFKEALGIE